jgi:hypothetical protein
MGCFTTTSHTKSRSNENLGSKEMKAQAIKKEKKYTAIQW